MHSILIRSLNNKANTVAPPCGQPVAFSDRLIYFFSKNQICGFWDICQAVIHGGRENKNTELTLYNSITENKLEYTYFIGCIVSSWIQKCDVIIFYLSFIVSCLFLFQMGPGLHDTEHICLCQKAVIQPVL